ncbi:MAG: isocitrate/isopropylmalate dehydrogenase family protein, partial [Planctomycetota bacterium]
MYKVTLIPGDGTGPEIVETAVKCIDALNAGIEWERVNAGSECMEKYGTPLPGEVIDSIRRNKVALKGPITTPIGTGFRSVNVALRHILDLYVCLRPCKLYKGVLSRFDNVDIVVIRENSEDLYAGIEFEEGKKETKELIEWLERTTGKKINKDSGISIKPISVTATRRIVKYAFEYARKYKRKKVTLVTKANIMKYTDGLFLKTGMEVAREYSDIEFDTMLVDNLCMQLVKRHEQFDILVLPNLYGDIVSDICAGLVGGLGVAPGANIGDEYAVFEAIHGSAPKYKGQNKVNPTALILSGMLMLRYLGEEKKADILEQAVANVIAEGKYVTYDFKVDRND